MLNGYKILLYNDEEMTTFQGIVKSINVEKPECVEYTTLDGNKCKYTLPITPQNIELVALVTDRVIDLEPTMMKRIAKYNKSEELEKLNEDIKEAKEKLKEINVDIKNQSNKLDSLKEFISDFMDSSYTNIDGYCANKYISDEEGWD